MYELLVWLVIFILCGCFLLGMASVMERSSKTEASNALGPTSPFHDGPNRLSEEGLTEVLKSLDNLYNFMNLFEELNSKNKSLALSSLVSQVRVKLIKINNQVKELK
jgi:hypothetical protein